MVAIAAVLTAFPAAAFADALGPGTSFYSTVSPTVRHYVADMVNIDLHRATGIALVNVSNVCLGTVTVTEPGPGGSTTTVADNASFSVRLRRGALSFDGRARRIAGQNAAGRVALSLRARVTARRATGTVIFPGKSCRGMGFVAPLRERTR